jgi:hypothetical protein
MPSTAKKPCPTRSGSVRFVAYVLEHFDQKTKRSSFYTLSAKWERADKEKSQGNH